MLHEVWSMLTNKYKPSVAAEATKLWIRFEGLRQRDRTMQEHVNECMTVRNKLLAINEPVPDRQFTHKLLNVDKEMYNVRATLAHDNIDAIISGLTDAYAVMHMNDPPRHQHRHQQGHAGRGRFHRRFPRGSGAPSGAGVAAMAAANGQGEDRACYNCNEVGHVRADCPKLHAAVRNYLKQQRGRGGRGRRGRGQGRGGPAIAAVSIPNLQSMVDSLPREKSTFLPNNCLIDSGAEISMCFDYNQFCEVGSSDVDQCAPVGSAPIDILGKGTIRVCTGKYVDFEGTSRWFDLEINIEDVYWVPQCPIHLLANESLRKQNMYLYTGPRGNELSNPGFADQEHGSHGTIDQKADLNGNPILVFCLGDGRPVWRTSHVDSGVTWMEQSAVLHRAAEHREIAAVQEPKGLHYVPDGFLAHLMYGHCGDAASRMISQAPDLYGDGLTPMGPKGHRLDCEGCHRAGHVKRNQGLHQGQLIGRADAPRASLHADVAGPIVHMGIGGVKYILAVVDEWSRFA